MDEDRRNNIIKDFFSPEFLTVFKEYSLIRAKEDAVYSPAENSWSTKFEPGIGHCIDIRGGDRLADALLQFSLPKISEIVGKKLETVASFYRIYGPDCKLPMHTDNPEYEWSATICMGYDAPDCWPIYVEEDAIHLEPGECLIYQGAEKSHGRPVFKGSWQTQLFLHYKEVKDEKNGQADS